MVRGNGKGDGRRYGKVVAFPFLGETKCKKRRGVRHEKTTVVAGYKHVERNRFAVVLRVL